MALGKQQAATVADASHQCARALKALGRGRLRTQAAKALAAAEPEIAVQQLMALALEASVNGPERAGEAFPTLQREMGKLAEVWAASPSAKHRTEMVRLFKRELKKGATLR
jgi:hypothetical protein